MEGDSSFDVTANQYSTSSKSVTRCRDRRTAKVGKIILFPTFLTPRCMLETSHLSWVQQGDSLQNDVWELRISISITIIIIHCPTVISQTVCSVGIWTVHASLEISCHVTAFAHAYKTYKNGIPNESIVFEWVVTIGLSPICSETYWPTFLCCNSSKVCLLCSVGLLNSLVDAWWFYYDY